MKLADVVKRKGDGMTGTVWACDEIGSDGKSYRCPNRKCGGWKVNFHSIPGSRVCMLYAELLNEFEVVRVVTGFEAVGCPAGKKVKEKTTGIFGIIHDAVGLVGYYKVISMGGSQIGGIGRVWTLQGLEQDFEYVTKTPDGCQHDLRVYDSGWTRESYCTKCSYKLKLS